MKLFKYIWIIILFYFVCSARTCVEDEDAAAVREEQYIKEMKDSIKHVFMSDSLSGDLLRSFEMTAEKKLIELADYLKIAADTTLDQKFRQQALEMAEDLIIPEKVVLNAWFMAYPGKKLVYSDFSTSQLHSEGFSQWAKPEQIILNIPLTRETDSLYKGSLSFCQKWFSFIDTQNPVNISEPLTIDFYLIKTMKSFGGQQLKVWSVGFGSIKQGNK